MWEKQAEAPATMQEPGWVCGGKASTIHRCAFFLFPPSCLQGREWRDEWDRRCAHAAGFEGFIGSLDGYLASMRNTQLAAAVARAGSSGPLLVSGCR